MSPRFTVIIPTRNRLHFLREAVTSVLAQSIEAEILVVDDGRGAAQALAGLSPTIRVLENHEAGPVPARILGVRSAETDYIAFLDDDDWFCARHHLAAAAAALDDGAALSFSDGTLVFDDGTPPLPFTRTADVHSLQFDNTILISAVCYRRDLHETLGPFDLALPYYWDWDWYLRVARSGARLAHIPAPTVSIRVHTGNMSGDSHEAARRANLNAFERKHGLATIPLKNHLTIAREA